ncbi:MAG: chromosome partitioning protein ParB family [Puniceicoccaceae bacterium 5H]|nr:MAG: chromosome partitioning protein ParB family [Puniceicoccaceae bacterium 5H]
MSTAKKRLGRGLGSLISGGVASPQAAAAAKGDQKNAGQASEPEAAPTGLLEIPIEKVEPNPHQPRREFNEERLQELAESIRSEGLLQPIVVRRVDDLYQLIAGERRWRACKLVGMKRVPARVMEASEASSAVLSLIENLQRADLNPVEEALGYASLMRDFDLTQEAVAERLGKGRATIANSLRLLQLDREIQGYLARGLLSTGHAKALLGMDDVDERIWLARHVIERGLSVRQTENMVQQQRQRRGNSKSERNVSAAEAAAVESFQKEIASYLNTEVQLKHSARKGRIVIDYYGNDDLRRILDRMGIQGE